MVHNLTSNEQSKKHVLAMGRIRSELGKKENEIWLFYRWYSYFVDLHGFAYEVVFVKKLQSIHQWRSSSFKKKINYC